MPELLIAVLYSRGKRMVRPVVSSSSSAPEGSGDAPDPATHASPTASPDQLGQAETSGGKTGGGKRRGSSPPPPEKRPKWAHDVGTSVAGSASDARTFQGRVYTAFPLADHHFVEGWAAPQPPAPAEPSSPAATIDWDTNAEEAGRHLRQVVDEALINHSECMEDIRQRSLSALSKFREEDRPLWRSLDGAFSNCLEYGRPFQILLNILLKHSNLKNFLQTVDKERYRSDENVDAYYRSFLNHHGYSEFSIGQLKFKLKFDFQTYAKALDGFLTTGAPILNDVTLAHVVATNAAPEISLAVKSKEYLTAFANGDPIFFDSVIKATASAESVVLLSDEDEILDRAISTLDVNDHSETASAQRRALLDKIGDDLKFKQLLHIFRCKDAKGIWLLRNEERRKVLPSRAGAGSGPAMSEESQEKQELLLARRHVVIPQRVIVCDMYLCLIADLTYLPQDDYRIGALHKNNS
jgi:hypothetical protein